METQCGEHQRNPEGVREEVEVKFTVNPNNMPADLREALASGSDHPDILRKGRMTQLYLEINPTTAALALEAICAESEIPLSDEERAYFSRLENISEIRILQRENDHLEEGREYAAWAQQQQEALTLYPDSFQITMKGITSGSGTVRPKIETPIIHSQEIAKAVVALLESLRDGTVPMSWQKRTRKIEKMWYDIAVPDALNPGSTRKVEMDVFPDLQFLAVAEIECQSREELESLRAAGFPLWFEDDITSDETFRARNLARKEDEEITSGIHRIIAGLHDKLVEFYQPTVLGAEVQLLEDISDLRFVLVGSFKRWLPQFRRIQQDLARRAKEVYPPITTLDIARRQIQNNDPKAAFRIEVEEDQELLEVEKDYLRKIRDFGALYIVAPEKRLGESSAEETVYALSKGSRVYMGNRIERMSKELPRDIQIIISAVIHAVLSIKDEDTLKRRSITDPIMMYLESTFDEDVLRHTSLAAVRALLRNSVREDRKRKQLERESQKTLGS